MIGTLGRISIGLWTIAVIIRVVEWLVNAYHVWQFNRTASTHDPRKVDRNWNWRK